MKKFLVYVIAAVLGGAISLGGAKMLGFDKSSPTQVSAKATPAAFVNLSPGLSASQPGAMVDFTYAAEKTLPAVVHIQVSTTINANARNGQDFDLGQLPEAFRDFFGNPFGPSSPNRRGAPEPQRQQGSGSGVIISPDGYIVTNNHVVADADEVLVTLNDHQTFTATVIGTDPSTDVALIKVDGKDLPSITMADADQIKVGAWVVAVGNPFNLESTVTAGIVSAKGRSINIMQDKTPIESFIQTDAAINPGNSGGALVNLQGELVGVNTAIASPTGTYAGYGFAIPSNIVTKVVTDLKEYGVVQRGFIGAIIRGIDSKLAKEKGLSTTDGVYVDSLAANSAAAEAGIKTGDVIIAVDGLATTSSPKLLEMIGRHRPGDKVALTILRKGQEKEVFVTLKNSEGNTQVVKKEAPAAVLEALGASFETVSKAEAQKMGIQGGVKLVDLQAGKLRSQTNIREGFVITKIDGKAVNKVEDVTKILQDKEGGVMLEGIYPGSSQTFYYAFGLQ
ncbi:MAG: Do family serine endopeptidase [Saprospiraceae bacterium]